jgi:hypothetical protein
LQIWSFSGHCGMRHTFLYAGRTICKQHKVIIRDVHFNSRTQELYPPQHSLHQ